MPFVDLESYASIKELTEQLGDQQYETDVNPYSLFQRLALNLSLTLGYGFRIDGSAEDELLREIVMVERGISTLRSTSNNWQDFVPLLRIFSRRSNEASELRQRRDTYLEYLLKRLKEKIPTRTDMTCITRNILKDPECKLAHGKTIS
jgi:phenylacetate 2-hydroxylase